MTDEYRDVSAYQPITKEDLFHGAYPSHVKCLDEAMKRLVMSSEADNPEEGTTWALQAIGLALVAIGERMPVPHA